MKFRFKVLSVAAVALGVLLAGCGQQSSASVKTKDVTIGIVGADKTVWKAVQKQLDKEDAHINLKIKEFGDYNQPNSSLQAGDIDLNAFQHQFFLDNWNKANKGTLVTIGKTVLAPLAVYSKKITSLKDLKKGDTVSIPNDPTNEGRALELLETAGFITLKNTELPTPADVKANKLDLKIKPLDAAQLPRTLADVDAAVINSGIAVDAKLNPEKAIYREQITEKSKPWINIIVARKADKSNKTYKKIVKAYQTSAVAKVIKKTYKSTEVPAWNYKF
ncbi:MetQ/NlpA family ABC transporter substrate-binding protein [Lacticaseibacillus jixianensis]|uniref:Lipoprotein n=1 Tax=Lacticaseibacillus jixianensis TaxID=2486012 RepID=A0ABW4BBN0_9LACO|nr:MetQ/NlpA family ABC transporter substrate-binding protein [Lacticaseibacillus jixianensis]